MQRGFGLYRIDLGGEDLAHATERSFAGEGKIGSILAIPAFFGGTIAGPFVAFYWGLAGDLHIITTLVATLPNGYLDIPEDNFTLAQHPFTGPRRIEEAKQELSCSR